jgi:hypothetical protein
MLNNIGAAGDGWSDDYSAIQSAIDSAPDPAVIFFPAGTYRIKSQLSLRSGILLRGEGSLKTHLEFLSASGCFGINGRTMGSYVDILSGLEKGSDKIVVSDASNFSVGQGGEIRQEDIVAPAASWGAIPAEVRRKNGDYVPQPKDLATPPAPTNSRILP